MVKMEALRCVTIFVGIDMEIVHNVYIIDNGNQRHCNKKSTYLYDFFSNIFFYL